MYNVSEQTAGEVIQMDVVQEEAPRKAWGVSPHSQVLRVLQEAELQPLTQQLELSSPGLSFLVFLQSKHIHCFSVSNNYIKTKLHSFQPIMPRCNVHLQKQMCQAQRQNLRF